MLSYRISKETDIDANTNVSQRKLIIDVSNIDLGIWYDRQRSE